MSTARIIQLLLCLAASAGTPAMAQQVEVHLRSGAVVKGEVVSDETDKLVIRSTSMGKSGKAMSITIPYKRSDIAEVMTLADPADEYRTRLLATHSAAEHLALAQWCREQNMADKAGEHAKRAVELDGTLEEAVKLASELDWMQLDGKWVHEAEALAVQGKVRYQGKVMTVAEADALKAGAQQQAAAAGAAKAADEKADSLAGIDRQIAELKKRPVQLEAELQKANSDLATAQGMAQKVASAKSALDSAQKGLDQARSANNAPRTGTAPANQTNLQPLTQAVETAQKALIAARRDAANAEGAEAQAKGRITALGNEKKALEKKLETLTARREATAKALEKAKAAEDKAASDAAKPPEAKPAGDAPAKPGEEKAGGEAAKPAEAKPAVKPPEGKPAP